VLAVQQRGDAANPRADDHAEAGAVDLGQIEPGVLHGHHRRGHCILEVGIEASRFLLVDEVQGIEIADLARDPRGIPVGTVSVLGVGVELGDRPDARASLDEPRPEFLGGVAERRERAQPGDDDPTALHDQELSLMYWMASPTVTIFSASSSGIWM